VTHAALIVSYARKENVLRLVEQSINSGVKHIYISIDGPRNNEIREIQTALKTELEKKQESFLGKIMIWQRELNMGSGASVIASLDWVFTTEESIYILEDDLVISQDFFTFMDYGLEEMRNHRDLKIVTGTNPFENVTRGRMGKLSYPVSWGWATNRDNWKDLRKLIFEETTSNARTTKIRKIQFWKVGKRRALLGQIEAWDVPLASEMHKTTYYTLVPPTNLVRNIGFDQFAAHTSESIWPLDMRMNDLANLESLIFSESELVNLDENFETEIFKIQLHHSISGLIQKLFDRYRFKQRTVKLSDRARLEEFPSR
jgi:hypothetical protein